MPYSPAADAKTPAASGNLAPANPALGLAVAGGNLAPATPGLTAAAGGGNLSPGAPGAATAAVSGGVLIDPAGAQNAFRLTYSGSAADGTFTIAAATAKATTDLAVVGAALTITPGTKAQMVVSGITTPAAANGYYAYDGLDGGGNKVYRLGNYLLRAGSFGGIPGTPCWVLCGDGLIDYVYFRNGSLTTYPDVAGWVTNAGTGAAAISAAASSAAQTIAAINSASATTLVSASPEGDVSGAVAALGPISVTNTGRSATAPALAAALAPGNLAPTAPGAIVG